MVFTMYSPRPTPSLWEERELSALWKRSNSSGSSAPIGINSNDVYLYIGPPNHDLTRLDGAYRINDSDKTKYTVDRAEKIFAGDRAVYIWAVIRKTTEA